ncbi:MAG: hypothetical protein JO161_02890 [Planctomycetaceae bacterium]|nr:hypothetical protein [Planctomycetaceae bacterium]
MRCPGVDPPDSTLGIADPPMLPPAKLVSRSRNYTHRPCPLGGKSCPRDRIFTRTLHDLDDPVAGRPRDIRLTYSQDHCTRCRRFFTANMSDLAAPRARYTHRVVALAVRLVVEDGLPSQAASGHLWRDYRVFAPCATIPNWVEARGEKGGPSHRGRFLPWGPRRLLRVHRRGRVVRWPLLRPVDRRSPRLQAAVLCGPRPGPDATGYPGVLPPLPGSPKQPRLDPSRDHHRRLGA